MAIAKPRKPGQHKKRKTHPWKSPRRLGRGEIRASAANAANEEGL